MSRRKKTSRHELPAHFPLGGFHDDPRDRRWRRIKPIHKTFQFKPFLSRKEGIKTND